MLSLCNAVQLCETKRTDTTWQWHSVISNLTSLFSCVCQSHQYHTTAMHAPWSWQAGDRLVIFSRNLWNSDLLASLPQIARENASVLLVLIVFLRSLLDLCCPLAVPCGPGSPLRSTTVPKVVSSTSLPVFPRSLDVFPCGFGGPLPSIVLTLKSFFMLMMQKYTM